MGSEQALHKWCNLGLGLWDSIGSCAACSRTSPYKHGLLVVSLVASVLAVVGAVATASMAMTTVVNIFLSAVHQCCLSKLFFDIE